MADECQEILDDLERFLDGECEADVEHLIATHLGDCPPCMDRSDFERRLRALIADSCRVRAPREVIERVRVRLGQLA